MCPPVILITSWNMEADMQELMLEGLLNPVVAERAGPFFSEMLRDPGDIIHSLHLTGSALT